MAGRQCSTWWEDFSYMGSRSSDHETRSNGIPLHHKRPSRDLEREKQDPGTNCTETAISGSKNSHLSKQSTCVKSACIVTFFYPRISLLRFSHVNWPPTKWTGNSKADVKERQTNTMRAWRTPCTNLFSIFGCTVNSKFVQSCLQRFILLLAATTVN